MAKKRCLVVGGSGHLGRVITKKLVAQGAEVALTYHKNMEAFESLKKAHPGIHGFALDLLVPEMVQEVATRSAQALGGLDGVVFAAAAPIPMVDETLPALVETSVEQWDSLMRVNVRGAFLVARAAAPLMVGGNLVFMGSVDGVFAMPTPVAYAASKGALISMVRSLAKELGEAGICVNAVSPGLLGGGITSRLPAELRAQYLKHAALGREGSPEEAAALVAWLLTENTYLNAQSLGLTGGL